MPNPGWPTLSSFRERSVVSSHVAKLLVWVLLKLTFGCCLCVFLPHSSLVWSLQGFHYKSVFFPLTNQSFFHLQWRPLDIHSLSSAPQTSCYTWMFSLPKSGLYFSLREKWCLSFGESLEPSAVNFSCVICLQGLFIFYLINDKTTLLFINNNGALIILIEKQWCRGDDC